MALVIQCCNVQQEKVTAVQWWNEISKLLGLIRIFRLRCTLTDHRNNVIKTICLCFEGKLVHVRYSMLCQNEF